MGEKKEKKAKQLKAMQNDANSWRLVVAAPGAEGCACLGLGVSQLSSAYVSCYNAGD